MLPVQDPIYSQTGGLFQMGDESATLAITNQQGLTAPYRKVVTSKAFTAARTLTLPTSVLQGIGTSLEITDVFGAVNGANTLTITPNGTDTINGVNASIVFTTAGERITLTSDGAGHWTGSLGGGASAGGSTQAKYTKNTTAGGTTAAQGDMTGGNLTYAEYSAVGAANLTTRTAAQLISDAGLQVGQTYTLRIINSSGGTTTLVGGTGVTITGTATMATQTWRDFQVKVNSLTAIGLQSVGTGTNS